jgi:uncharacterized RDD family membrane protein YckC
MAKGSPGRIGFDWPRFAKDQLIVSAVCLLLVLLVVAGSEFLYYVSDGKIPRFIEWHPAPVPRFDDTENEEDE